MRPLRPTRPNDEKRTWSMALIAPLPAVLALTVVAGCGKVPPPEQLFADKKAERRTAICAAWQYGGPRQILTDAARGDGDRKVLAQMLLPEWTDEDPDELRDAYATLHDGAARLQRGEDGEKVLRDDEAALATTDRFYATQCASTVASSGSTGTRPR